MTEETLSNHVFINETKFLGFHAVVLVKIFPLMYQLLLSQG